MFDEEKQFTKIISRIKFIIENSLWLVELIKTLDLAIIIKAAIRMLSKIRMDDIVSIDEKFETDELIKCRWIRFVDAISVIINKVDIVIHQ